MYQVIGLYSITLESTPVYNSRIERSATVKFQIREADIPEMTGAEVYSRSEYRRLSFWDAMGLDGTLGIETCFVASLGLKATEKFVCLGAVYDEAGLTEVRKGSRVVLSRWLSKGTFRVGRTPPRLRVRRTILSLEYPPRNHSSRRALEVARRLGAGEAGEDEREERAEA